MAGYRPSLRNQRAGKTLIAVDERNGGNVSRRLLPEDVAPYKNDFYDQPRQVELTQHAPDLANEYFIVTGSGKFFRNVQLAPSKR